MRPERKLSLDLLMLNAYRPEERTCSSDLAQTHRLPLRRHGSCSTSRRPVRRPRRSAMFAGNLVVALDEATNGRLP
jgi:hypothetical protein